MEKHQSLRQYIKALDKDLGHSLIVLGRAGIGKTSTTLDTLKELNYKEGQHYYYITSYISPLQLYKKLQEINRLQYPKLLILDDCEAVFKSPQAVGILKSALWETPDNKRKVCWISGSLQLEDVDKEFNFEGKIIFLLNELNIDNPSIKAISDRALFYKFNLTKEEVVQLIKKRSREWSDKDISLNKRIEIADYISSTATDETSLRLLTKAFQMYKISPNHYKSLISNLT